MSCQACDRCTADKYAALDALDEATQAELDAIEDEERAEAHWNDERNGGMHDRT